MEHSKASLGKRHPSHNWEYADAAARTGATGFIHDDLGKIAWQRDNDSFWVLSTVAPLWVQIGAGGAPSAHASTHEVGGSDLVQHQSLTGAGSNTHAQLDDHVTRTAVVNGVGNPNATVTGSIGQTYRDLTNDIWYRCIADSSTNWEIV